MPQIIITTDGPDTARGTEVHRERVDAADLETDTASQLLIERIGWALSDADQLEHAAPAPARANRPGGTARRAKAA